MTFLARDTPSGLGRDVAKHLIEHRKEDLLFLQCMYLHGSLKRLEAALRVGEVEFSGSTIKDAILRAAFRAAESGETIDAALLEQAGIATCREMGILIRVKKGRVHVDESKRSDLAAQVRERSLQGTVEKPPAD